MAGKRDWRARRAYQRLWRAKNRKRHNSYGQLWKQKNREKVREYRQKRNSELRRDVFTHYSGGIPACACCRTTYEPFLSVDHIDGVGAKHRKNTSAKRIYEWLKKNNYPIGYQVLCHNCNWNKRTKDFCDCPFGTKRKMAVNS